MSSIRAAVPCLLSFVLAGCMPDDLPPGSYLDRERVLGVRVEAEGAPERSSPAPGERATARWIVAGPDDGVVDEWTLAACAGAVTGCTAEPFALAHDRGVEPTLSFTVPPLDELDDRTHVWVGGEIGSSKVLAGVPLAVGTAGPNHNPSFDSVALAVAGSAWAAATPPIGAATGCARPADATALPLLHASEGAVEISVDVSGVPREAFVELLSDGTPRARQESLQVSHFTTLGTLDRQFSVVDDEAAAGVPLRLDWHAPDDTSVVPADGIAVRFVFVLRDGRGGLDATSRFACVVP